MNDTERDDRMSVYEIGYLLAGLPEERVPAEADSISEIVKKNGGAIIAAEAPRHERLAYTIRKKTVSGSYDKYDSAHFGWIKFESGSDKIGEIKKAAETLPSVLRMLVITTARENTYLGKRAQAVAASLTRRPVDAVAAPAKPVAEPATVEEMDKSIEAMVKEV